MPGRRTTRIAGGVTGQWTSTMAAPGSACTFRALYGEHGSLRWGEGLQTRSEKLTTRQLVKQFLAAISEEEKERLFPRGIIDMVATELKEFIDAVLHGTPVEITGTEGYKDEAISLALYESSELGAPVRLAQVENLEIEAYQGRFNRALGLSG